VEGSATHADEASRQSITVRSRLGALGTRLRALLSVTKHPLLLIAVGAIVSGILVPTLTRGAQDHRQALEIKSDLVASMSAAASPFLGATLANVLVHRGEVPRSYDVAYQRWFARSSDVSTRLNTYFPDEVLSDGETLSNTWLVFSLRMRDLYYYFRVSPAEGSVTRNDYNTGGLQRLVDSSPGAPLFVDFKHLDRWLSNPRRRFDDRVNFYMEELLEGFRRTLNSIVAATLEADPRL
jgi:hypothetical protein